MPSSESERPFSDSSFPWETALRSVKCRDGGTLRPAARLMLKGFKPITESKAVPGVFPQAQTLLTTLHWFCKPLSFPSQNIKELRASKKANLYWKSHYKLLITSRHTNRLKFRKQRTYDLCVLLVLRVYDFYNTLKNVNYLIKCWFWKEKQAVNKNPMILTIFSIADWYILYSNN